MQNGQQRYEPAHSTPRLAADSPPPASKQPGAASDQPGQPRALVHTSVVSFPGESAPLRTQNHELPAEQQLPPAPALKSKAAHKASHGAAAASASAHSAAEAASAAPALLKLPRHLQAALDRVSNSEVIHAASQAAAASGAAAALVPRKKTKITAGLWVQPSQSSSPQLFPENISLPAAAAAPPAHEWAVAQSSASGVAPSVPKLLLEIPSSVPPSHVRVHAHTGIIDAAASGSLAAVSIDPNAAPEAAQAASFAISRPIFPPVPSADSRSIATALSRYMDRLLQQLPDSALCRALLQARGPPEISFENEAAQFEDDVRLQLRDSACQQLLKCFARDGVFSQAARDIFAALDAHGDGIGQDGDGADVSGPAAVEAKLLVCNTVLSEVVRSCSAACVEQGLLIDRCFALARDAVADLAFDHDSRYAAKLNAVLEESRGLRRRIVELEENAEEQDACIAELRHSIANFEQSMKTLKQWLETSRKEEAAAQHSLEIAKSNLQQERAVGVQLRTATSMMASTQIEVRQKMENALKEVVRLSDEVATLQAVKSKSGMQKLASEAGLGGMRVTDKLKNALKQLAVTRNDLMKMTQENVAIGEEMKLLGQERDLLREKLSNLSPKLDSLFARETALMSELEGEANARKRLAAMADEQKIVIVDLQKQLMQLQTKISLQQKTRAKAGEGDDELLASTSQLLQRTRIAAEASGALFSNLEGDLPANPNDKCIQAEVGLGGGKVDQASLFQNLLETAKAEVALSRARLAAAEKEIEQHLAVIEQQRAAIFKLENAPPPLGPDAYEVFCQTDPIFAYAEDMAAKAEVMRLQHAEAISTALASAAGASSEAETLRHDLAQLTQRYELECKSVDALRDERGAACAAMLEAIDGWQTAVEGKGGKKPGKEGKEKGGKDSKGSKDSKDGKDGKEKAPKKKNDEGDSQPEDFISGRVSAHIASSSQTSVARSDTNENVLVCAAQLSECLEAAARGAVANVQKALAAAEKEIAAVKKELVAAQEQCHKAEESLSKIKSDKESKAKAAEAKAAEERARKEAEAAAAAVAAQFAAAAAAEAAAAAAAAKAAKAAAAAKAAIKVDDASSQTDSFDGAGAVLSKIFEGKLTLSNLAVQLQNIRGKGLFKDKDKNDATPSKLELQLSQQVARLSSGLADLHVQLAAIVPDYIPPTPEKMEQYAASDAAAVAAAAEAAKMPAIIAQPAALASVTTESNATQTSRASTSHGPPTPAASGGFSLAEEERRLKHEDRILREKIRQLEMTLGDSQRALGEDSALVADFRERANNLKDSIAKEKSRDRRQMLAGKLEAVEEQQLEASCKEAASDARVRQLKTELFNLQHSRFLVVSSLDALTLPPPVAITITRDKLSVALDVEPSFPGITGIKSSQPPAVSTQLCTLCRLPMMDSSVTNAEIGLKEMQQRAILLQKETDAISANMAEFIAWKHQQQQQQQQEEQVAAKLPRKAKQPEAAPATPDHEKLPRVQAEAEVSLILSSPATASHRPPSQPPPPPQQQRQQQQFSPFTQRSYLTSPPPPAPRGPCAMGIDWPKQEAAAYSLCRDALLSAAASGWNAGHGAKSAAGRDQRDVIPLPLLQLNRFIEDALDDAFKAEILCATPCAAVLSTRSFPHILCGASSRRHGEGSGLSKALVVRAVVTAWSISTGSGGGVDAGSGHVTHCPQLLAAAAHALASGHWGSCCLGFFLLLRAMIGPTHADTRVAREQLLQAVAAVFAGSKWASNAAAAVARLFAQDAARGDASCHEVMAELLKMFVAGWEAYVDAMKECFRRASGASAAEADGNVWLSEDVFCSVILGMHAALDAALVAGWWRGLRKMGDGFHSGVPLLMAMMLIDRQRLFMMEIGVSPLGNRVAAGAESLALASEEWRQQEQVHAAQTGSFSPLKMKTAAVLKQRLQ